MSEVAPKKIRQTVNNFIYIGVDYWSRPNWQSNLTKRTYCVVDRVFSEEEVTDAVLLGLLTDINEENLLMYFMSGGNSFSDPEPDSPIKINKIPIEDIQVNRKK